jgi:hypothetical protein
MRKNTTALDRGVVIITFYFYFYFFFLPSQIAGAEDFWRVRERSSRGNSLSLSDSLFLFFLITINTSHNHVLGSTLVIKEMFPERQHTHTGGKKKEKRDSRRFSCLRVWRQPKTYFFFFSFIFSFSILVVVVSSKLEC